MSENLTQLDSFCLFVFSSSVENEFVVSSCRGRLSFMF